MSDALRAERDAAHTHIAQLLIDFSEALGCRADNEDIASGIETLRALPLPEEPK